MAKWYEKSFKRNLVDMHIPCWEDKLLSRYDDKSYVDTVALGEVDSAILYTSNCLGYTFFPDECAHSAIGDGDFVSGRVSELKKRGIDTVLYYNIYNSRSALEHPDWQIKDMRVDAHERRLFRCCINSEGFRNRIKRQLGYVCRTYDFVGVWIDMCAWHGAVCACDSCKAKFKREYGKEIPTEINWRSRDFAEFIEAREKWLVEFLTFLKKIVTDEKPDATVTFQNALWSSGWAGGVTQKSIDLSEFLAGDFYDQPIAYSAICKYLNSASKNRPIEFMTSLCASLAEHTTMKTRRELRHSFAGAIVHNAAFTTIDAIDPVGTINPHRHKMMGEIAGELSLAIAEISPNAKPVADVTYYCNNESFYRDQGVISFANYRAEKRYLENMKSFAQIMTESGIAFNINVEKNLENIDTGAIFVGDMKVLSEREADYLRSFVERGGTLVCTYETGIMKRRGEPLGDFILSDLLGVHYHGRTEENTVYLSPTKAGLSYFKDYDEGYPIGLVSNASRISADADTTVLATLTLPVSKNEDEHHFASALSNPPYVETDIPAVTERKVGLGRAIYIACPLEIGRFESHRSLLSELLTRGLERKVVAEKAPLTEILVYDDAERSRYQIHALSIMPRGYDVESENISVKIKTDRKVASVKDLLSGERVPFDQKDGYLILSATIHNGYASFIAE